MSDSASTEVTLTHLRKSSNELRRPPPIDPISDKFIPPTPARIPRDADSGRRRLSALAGLAILLLSSCQSAPVPISDQTVLDRALIRLPETLPQGGPEHPRMVRVLRTMGFEWNDPRFTLGHHLYRENEVAWFDKKGALHVTRYTGFFRETGYRIRRYVPSPSGDLEHRGDAVRGGLLRCLFNRPASALHWHRQISSVDLLAEMVVGAPIDLLILPASIPLCFFSDRQPSTFLHAEGKPDRSTVIEARDRYLRLVKKGNRSQHM